MALSTLTDDGATESRQQAVVDGGWQWWQEMVRGNNGIRDCQWEVSTDRAAANGSVAASSGGAVKILLSYHTFITAIADSCLQTFENGQLSCDTTKIPQETSVMKIASFTIYSTLFENSFHCCPTLPSNATHGCHYSSIGVHTGVPCAINCINSAGRIFQ